MDVNVTLKGPFFEKDVPRIVEKQILHEILGKVEERTERQGRGLGAQKNRIDHTYRRLELTVDTTRIYPRTKGTSWQKKNIGIIKSMAPRVARKAAERIAAEL
jgi:hypothetical protein